MKKVGLSKKGKIIIILGPTSSGKSDLAVKIAKKFNGEIISADSRQVYKGLDIGSGKITKKEMRGVKHHLLDVVSPIYSDKIKKYFSVSDFQNLAYIKIDKILEKNKLPILTGGTAFYLQSIIDGVILPDTKINQKLRSELEKKPLKDLQKKLQILDPVRYSEIDIKNKVRIIRAIEIASKIGRVPKIKKDPKYEVLQIGLFLKIEELEKNITLRLEKRMRAGMLKEAIDLHNRGLSWKRMEAMGLEYQYMALYLKKKISKEELLEQIKIKSRQLAKRQMTWFKKDRRIKWFAPSEINKIEKEIKNFIT